MAQIPDEPSRLVWRFPPWQPAVLILVAAACAAFNIYGHPSSTNRLLTVAAAVVALAVSVALLRMALVVDSDGIAVRFLRDVQWVPWSQVKQIGIADVRGNETVRVIRLDDTQVDVPPSLLQPTRPTSKPKASAQLRFVVSQISALNPADHVR